MSFYARRGGDRGSERFQGGGRGGYAMRGRSGLPPRGPLGINARPSARIIAKELFSEVGHLKRFAVHFDGYGRQNGTAEVVFTRRSDAIAALKRYNNVLLDGKSMKIEVIGSDLGLSMTPRINVVGASNGRATRTVVMTPETGRRGGGSSTRPLSNPTTRLNRGAFQAGRGAFQAGRGGGRGYAPSQAQFQGRGRGRGQFRGRGRGRGMKGPEKSADDLDKDLESYHAEAMKTD
ncbi:hypothetical protein ACQJBY_013799 [Aegilops geniculata]